eukprot:m.91787 g.91787  ORF g.91787 m.91787 type:complete len:678 (-) comp13319_c0_seq1:195-2228(-)
MSSSQNAKSVSSAEAKRKVGESNAPITTSTSSSSKPSIPQETKKSVPIPTSKTILAPSKIGVSSYQYSSKILPGTKVPARTSITTSMSRASPSSLSSRPMPTSHPKISPHTPRPTSLSRPLPTTGPKTPTSISRTTPATSISRTTPPTTISKPSAGIPQRVSPYTPKVAHAGQQQRSTTSVKGSLQGKNSPKLPGRRPSSSGLSSPSMQRRGSIGSNIPGGTGSPIKDRKAILARQQKSLKAALQKRKIPEVSIVMQSQPGGNIPSRKRRRFIKEEMTGSTEDFSSSEGELGMEGNLEHDAWALAQGEDETKATNSWAHGMPVSDDDSEGASGEGMRSTDACSEEEVFAQRKAHLIKLRSLYASQFQRLKRILDLKYQTYCSNRTKIITDATAGGTPINIPGQRKRIGSSKAPPPKRKHLPDVTPGLNDDLDIAHSHYHRYHKQGGEDEALLLQHRRRAAAGHSYPLIAPPKSGTPGARLQCIFHPAHMPPCYNRVMPFSKYCFRHILKDTNQVLYKSCTYSEGTGCDVPILRSQQPPLCDLHITLSDFMRNPRLSRAPPEHYARAAAGFGSAPLDLMQLEAFVNDDINMSVDLGLVTGFDLPEDESKAVAELQSSLQMEMEDVKPNNPTTSSNIPPAAGKVISYFNDRNQLSYPHYCQSNPTKTDAPKAATSVSAT